MVSSLSFFNMSPIGFLNGVVTEINSLKGGHNPLRQFTAHDFVTVQRMNEIADAINGLSGNELLGRFETRETVSSGFRRIEQAMHILTGEKVCLS